MKEKEIFIHIGYPKTATTTLQEYLFPNHKDLVCLKTDTLPFFKDMVYSRENYVKSRLEYYKKN